MKTLSLIALVVALFLVTTVCAAERTVTLHVDNATCELCGPIVKRSLTRVPGVLDIRVSESEGAALATVRFDDTRTDVASLIKATTNAGYPSRVAK
jgi:periplasmic mercuric ion binding protein